MFTVASRSDVQVRVIAQNTRRLHGILLMVARQLLQRIVGLLIDEISLLDPAFQPAGRAHPRETFFTIDDFQALAIFYIADAVVNGRNLIAQRRLRS